MAFTPITANVTPLSINDYVPDFVAAINMNNDEFKLLIESLYNDLQISTADKTIGSSTGLASLYSAKLEADASTGNGFILTKINGVNRNIIGYLRYETLGLGVGSPSGSVLMTDRIICNTIISAQTADIYAKTLSLSSGLTLDAAASLTLNGNIILNNGIAEKPNRFVYANCIYNISTNISEATIDLTKNTSKNIHLIVQVDNATYSSSWASGLLGIKIKLNIAASSVPDGQVFNITIAKITNSAGTEITTLPGDKIDIYIVPGTYIPTSAAVTFTENTLNIANKIVMIKGSASTPTPVPKFKTNVDMLYSATGSGHFYHVRNVYNPN